MFGKQKTTDGWQIETDEWTIDWHDGQSQIDINHKPHKCKHTRFCGDPHIQTDGEGDRLFPTPTASFMLTDGTVLVIEAPGANQALNGARVFGNEGSRCSFGQDIFKGDYGTVFVQKPDGCFRALRDDETKNVA
jgi:hypothetical protein